MDSVLRQKPVNVTVVFPSILPSVANHFPNLWLNEETCLETLAGWAVTLTQ